jgi:cell division transport system permease protein
MRAALARVRYCVADAAEEWRHSPGVNLLATATLTAVLFVAGITLLLLFNLESRLDEWRKEIRVTAYLRDGVSTDTVDRLRRQLSRIEGVRMVEYVDKNQALDRFRRSFGEMADLPARLQENPLPASLEAHLAGGAQTADVARSVRASLAREEGVEEVRYDREWLDRLDDLLSVTRWTALALAVLVFCAVAFVMSAVMRLAVHARREEVDIMLLVGASPGLVRGPFLVAGLFQGLAGTAAALVLVEALRRFGLSHFEPRPALLDLLAGTTLPLGPSVALLGAGLIVSCASASFAVRR